MTTVLLSLLTLLEVEHHNLHRAIAATTIVFFATDLDEIRDLMHLAWVESRWKPNAISRKGACGLWQQIPRYARPPTTCKNLIKRPVHAALTAIDTTRTMRRLCGPAWKVCYQYGPSHRVARKEIIKYQRRF